MSDTLVEIESARTAVPAMASLGTDTKNRALKAMAEALDSHREEILAANAEDVRESEGRISPQMARRLVVDSDKVDDMISSILGVMSLPDPVWETMDSTEMDEGLDVYKVRCPIGLIGIIFEARPDVVPQIMSLCLKAGDCVAFKGGSEAAGSNRILFDVLVEAAASEGVPAEAFVLMESREQIDEILSMDRYIDLLIPRGSYSFVRYIQDHTRIPVLGHSSGLCHVYVDSEADMKKALDIAYDSKVQYPAVCNAMETLLVDKTAARYFIPRIADRYVAAGVEIRADPASMVQLIGFDVKAAEETDWDAEYDDLVISVRIVDGIDEAIRFINSHGSHHTDSIVTENREKAAEFIRRVDSADVVVNASTRFADGYRIGLGAEVGISTGKIHARGPMGMEGLTTYKYIIIGNGHKVSDYSGKDARPYSHRKTDRRYGL